MNSSQVNLYLQRRPLPPPDSKHNDPDSVHFTGQSPLNSNEKSEEPSFGAMMVLDASKKLDIAKRRFAVAYQAYRPLYERDVRARKAEATLQGVEEWFEEDSDSDDMCEVTPKSSCTYSTVGLGVGAGLVGAGYVWGSAFMGIGGCCCLPLVVAGYKSLAAQRDLRNPVDQSELYEVTQEAFQAEHALHTAQLTVVLQERLQRHPPQHVLDYLGPRGVNEIAFASASVTQPWL